MLRQFAILVLGTPIALFGSGVHQSHAEAVITPALPATASSPSPVTFTLSFGHPPAATRTWSATGSVTDGGIWTFTDVDFTGSILHSPVVGVVHDTFQLTSSDGSTITIADQALFSVNGFKDQWRIAEATGDYVGLQGEGTGALGTDLSLFGQAHFVGV